MCIIARIIAHIVHNSTHNSAHNSDEIREISARYERDLNARDDVVASAVVARTAVVRTVAARAAAARAAATVWGGQRWARRQMRCEVVVRAAEIRVAAGSAVAWVANWRAGDAGGGL